jgi:hypothetical protein
MMRHTFAIVGTILLTESPGSDPHRGIFRILIPSLTVLCETDQAISRTCGWQERSQARRLTRWTSAGFIELKVKNDK